ncbi:MAG: hypothetical protein WBO07_00415 [Formosimonas sp.]
MAKNNDLSVTVDGTGFIKLITQSERRDIGFDLHRVGESGTEVKITHDEDACGN